MVKGLFLEPCLRCKGENVSTGKWSDDRKCVYCKDCAYTGPLAQKIEVAADLWNGENREGQYAKLHSTEPP